MLSIDTATANAFYRNTYGPIYFIFIIYWIFTNIFCAFVSLFFAGLLQLVRHQEEGWTGTCCQIESLRPMTVGHNLIAYIWTFYVVEQNNISWNYMFWGCYIQNKRNILQKLRGKIEKSLFLFYSRIHVYEFGLIYSWIMDFWIGAQVIHVILSVSDQLSCIRFIILSHSFMHAKCHAWICSINYNSYRIQLIFSHMHV